MSTRCVRYIQSCVSPASQSVKHTHCHVHSLAHTQQHNDVPLDCGTPLACRERALVCWVRSPARQMNAAPQLRGHSLAHIQTHARSHTHAPQATSQKCVFVSLLLALVVRFSFSVLTSDNSRETSSLFPLVFGLVFVEKTRVRFRWSCFET
ncbi:hypothetical protein QQF64_008000 [Cirrhinus molitorella]|uniref:Uncharacterized protein n=1 Tax=Cirrhinus molitorella TaxID=172907 RepID=A0ABR3M4W6_9TELE